MLWQCWIMARSFCTDQNISKMNNNWLKTGKTTSLKKSWMYQILGVLIHRMPLYMLTQIHTQAHAYLYTYTYSSHYNSYFFVLFYFKIIPICYHMKTSTFSGSLHSAFGKWLGTFKRCWEWFPLTRVSKNRIKMLHFTGIALQPLFNNWIQWNNNTLQQQLRYWQTNLRTVV
jgi:hypothetical protein